jgi:glycosyltransferase involved in cell wall biosynthesis
MKILILSWRDIKSPFAGGAEIFTFENARRWVASGHEVTWFTSGFETNPKEESIEGVKIIRRGSETTVHYQAFRHYHKFFRGKFDLVIDEINTIPFFTPLYIKEKKVVLIFQLAREVWFHETFFPLSLIGFFAEYFYLRIYRNIPVITISESTKQDLLNLGFSKKIFVLPIGITFKPLEQVPQKEDNPTLVFVGRLRRSKRVHHIIKALRFLKIKIPNIRLRIIGRVGRSDYLSRLNHLIRKYDLGENVIFHGYVDELTKQGLLKKAHAIVITSAREGWGLAVTEANALSTPAIAYNVPGLKDSIRNGETGILVKKNSPHSLSRAILTMLQDKGLLYQKLSLNALEWSKKFCWDKSAEQSLTILSDLNKIDTSKKIKNVVLVAEMTIPPISRANLRPYRLGLALRKYGYNIYMITPSKTPFQRKSFYQEGIFMNQFWGFSKYLYSNIRIIVRFYHLLGSIFSIIWLQIRFFDIYFIHAWNPLAGLAAAIAGKILRKKVYIDFTDFYSDIARTDLPLMVPILRFIERFILSSAEKVFVVSNEMVNVLDRFGVKKEKLYIIPDGVDSKMFNPSINGQELRKKMGLENLPVIIYHGDTKHPDGVDLLLQSFVLVVKKIPDVKLLIVGGGRGKYFKKLEKTIRQLKLEKSIYITGWVEHSMVPEYISISNVGAMPMRGTLNHNCYLSFKLFEYWAMGKPIVVSRLDAISKIVQDGVNGYIFEPENIEEMAQAYIKIFSDINKTKIMGQAGRELVEKNFDWNILMAKEASLLLS